MMVKAKERGLYRGRLVEAGEVFDAHEGFKGRWAEPVNPEDKPKESAPKVEAKPRRGRPPKAKETDEGKDTPPEGGVS